MARATPSGNTAAKPGRAVRAELLSSAVTFEEQLRRELLSIDQTLRILEYEWQRDASHFDLGARAAQVVVVNDVALQLFIADDHAASSG